MNIEIEPKDIACRSAIEAAATLFLFKDAIQNASLVAATNEYIKQVREFWQKPKRQSKPKNSSIGRTKRKGLK